MPLYSKYTNDFQRDCSCLVARYLAGPVLEIASKVTTERQIFGTGNLVVTFNANRLTLTVSAILEQKDCHKINAVAKLTSTSLLTSRYLACHATLSIVFITQRSTPLRRAIRDVPK